MSLLGKLKCWSTYLLLWLQSWFEPAHWSKQLRISIYSDNLDVFDCILEQEIVAREIGSKQWSGHESPLLDAAFCGKDHMVNLLLDKGAKVNSMTGVSPLHWAVYNNHLSTVRILVKRGADVTICGTYSEFPFISLSGNALDWAQSIGNYNRIKKIVDLVAQEKREKEEYIKFELRKKLGSVDILALMRQKLSEKLELKRQISRAVAINEKIEEEKIKGSRERMVTWEIKEIYKAVEKQKIRTLQCLPAFRSEEQIKKLKQNLKTLETITRMTETKEEPCLVCCEPPKQIFLCHECDNWICDKCHAKLVRAVDSNCPICRARITTKSFKRSRALERALLV